MWKLIDCININLNYYDINGGSPFVYELQFELDPLFPEQITVIYDRTGIEAECRKIKISVEEAKDE